MSQLLKAKIGEVFSRLVARDLATTVTLSRETVVFDPETQSSVTGTLTQKVGGTIVRNQNGYRDPVVEANSRVLMIPASGLKWAPELGDSVRFPDGAVNRIGAVDALGPTTTALVYKLALV
jgi:hypothetical protein